MLCMFVFKIRDPQDDKRSAHLCLDYMQKVTYRNPCVVPWFIMWAGSNLSFGNTHIHTHTPCSVIPVRALNYLCHDHGECCQASHCSEYIWLHYPTTHGVAPWGDMLPLDSHIFDFIKWRYLTPRGWIRPCVSTIRIIDTWTPLPLKSITIFWILYAGRPKYQQEDADGILIAPGQSAVL